MKIKIILILLVIFSFSCNKNSKIESAIARNPNDSTTIVAKTNSEKFDFKKFKIKKGQIGNMKIGMKISEVEKKLIHLTKKETEAFDFGYDGGGKAYIYSFKNEPILALIPKRDSEEILVIIALSKNLKTNNGLNPNSTVKEIQEKYPEIQINQNMMMNWEFMHDEKNNWDLIFTTEENNQIGKYKELEIPTNPIRTEIKMNWITIK